MLARLAALLTPLALVALLAPLWLPLPGTLLVGQDPPAVSDAALVLDGSGAEAVDGAERWRQTGLVRDVVLVETPVKTHGLVAYWSDFVAWGLARPSPTPPEHLRLVRAASPEPAAQARAAIGPLRAEGITSVLVPNGGIGSRLSQRDVGGTLAPAGIAVRVVPFGPPARDPARWYENADDRRAVLDLWVGLGLTAIGY
jgi:hypothetical protein